MLHLPEKLLSIASKRGRALESADRRLVQDKSDITQTFKALAKQCAPSLFCISCSRVYNMEKVAISGGIEQSIIPVQSAFTPCSCIKNGFVYASFFST